MNFFDESPPAAQTESAAAALSVWAAGGLFLSVRAFGALHAPLYIDSVAQIFAPQGDVCHIFCKKKKKSFEMPVPGGRKEEKGAILLWVERNWGGWRKEWKPKKRNQIDKAKEGNQRGKSKEGNQRGKGAKGAILLRVEGNRGGWKKWKPREENQRGMGSKRVILLRGEGNRNAWEKKWKPKRGNQRDKAKGEIKRGQSKRKIERGKSKGGIKERNQKREIKERNQKREIKEAIVGEGKWEDFLPRPSL